MTSKISFSKMFFSFAKEHLWVPIMNFVFLFIYIPVTIQFSISVLNISPSEVIENTIGGSVFTIILIIYTTVLAVICASAMFVYLHRKVSMDFFGSVAVSRTKLFVTHYLSGLFVLIIPFLIIMILTLFVVCPINGILTTAVMTTCAEFAFIAILSFVAMYTIAVFAMIITGRLINGIIMGFISIIYVPALYLIIEIIKQCGLYAIWANPSITNIYYISPITALMEMAVTDSFPRMALLAGIVATYTIVILILTLILDKHRRAESAGSGFAFRIAHPVIKVLIMIPAALLVSLLFGLIGNIFEGTSDYLDLPSYFIGFVIAFAIGELLIELIFTGNFRNVWRHWRSLLVAVLITLAISLVFVADVLGINSWIPDKGSVETISVYSDVTTEQILGIDSYESPIVGYNCAKAILDRSSTDDIDQIYDFANGQLEKHLDNNSSDDTETCTIFIRYELSCGKTFYRKIRCDTSDTEAFVHTLSKEDGYMSEHDPLEVIDLSYITGGTLINESDFTYYNEDDIEYDLGEEDTSTELSNHETHELLACIIKDIAESEVDENDSISYKLYFEQSNTLTVQNDDISDIEDDGLIDGSVSVVSSVAIYPSYTNTIDYIEGSGLLD